MSGIFGVVTIEKERPITADIAAMQPAMQSWGRDRDGLWQGAGVALGHQLHIDTPESRSEQQPSAGPAESGWRISADARIDNREELLASLSLRSSSADPLTDDQLILHAWLKWGEECLNRLVGAFVFVLWHESTRTLIAARDHLGCRPLFYHHAKGRLLWASDVRAILAVDGVPHDIDELALLSHVARYHVYLRSRSHWQGVMRLEPGHMLIWKNGELHTKRHWRPETIVEDNCSLREGADKMKSLLDTAVTAQLRTVHRVGVHLSGGIDSGAVAVLAHQTLGQRGDSLAGAYSWSPPPNSAEGAGGAEYPRIAWLESQLGLSCRYCDLTEEDFYANFQRDPTIEPTELILYENVMKTPAANDGAGVMLSGWGGDEYASFNGRGVMAARFWSGRWFELYREVSQMGGKWRRRWSLARSQIWEGRPLLLSRFGSDPMMAKIDGAYPQWRQAFRPDEIEQITAWRRERVLQPGVRATMLALGAGGHLANRMTDWATLGGEGGLQYRFPLLDRRVVEAALAMPDRFFWHDGVARYGMKLACTDLLPQKLVWRSPKREPSRMGRMDKVAHHTYRKHATAQADDPVSRHHRQQASIGMALVGK